MYAFQEHQLEGRLHRGVGATVQERPMSSRYVTVDPATLACQIMATSPVPVKATVVPIVDRREHKPNPFKAVVSAVFEEEHLKGYLRQVNVLCGHDGRTSVRAIGGSLRVQCENQFAGSVLFSFTHVSDTIHEFMADPARFLLSQLEQCDVPALRAESLAGVRGGDRILNALALNKPKLAHAVARQLPNYQRGELTLWDLVQAMTGAKRPGLTRIAADLLGPSFDMLKQDEPSAAVLA